MLFYCLDIWISHPGSSRRTRGQVEGCPAGSPAQINGPAGAAPRQTSGAFAEEEGGAAERAKPAACGGMRDAELVPTRAPLCVVAGVGFIREGPHRKGPSLVRPFGYFSGEGKVPRGTGAEPPKNHHAMSFSISSSREPNRSRASWTGLGLDMSTPAPFSRSTGSLEQPPERN